MPTYKLLYTCSKTGIKVYTNGIYKKIVYPNGKKSMRNTEIRILLRQEGEKRNG